MAFPVTVKFNRTLKAAIHTENIGATLTYIQKEIEKKKAGKITRDDSCVNYKGSTSYSRGALFGGMSGTFTLVNKNDKSGIVYEIRMYNLFITTAIMAVVFGLITQMVWAGVGGFAWLCGMNWFTSLIRHGSLANELAAGIDQLHGVPVAELDDEGEPIRDERLKSRM